MKPSLRHDVGQSMDATANLSQTAQQDGGKHGQRTGISIAFLAKKGSDRGKRVALEFVMFLPAEQPKQLANQALWSVAGPLMH